METLTDEFDANSVSIDWFFGSEARISICGVCKGVDNPRVCEKGVVR